MKKINVINNTLPKPPSLYVKRKVDEDAENRIKYRDEADNEKKQDSRDDIYITGLSKVGKKTFSTSAGNLNFDKETTEYIACEIEISDSKSWLNLLFDLKNKFEEDLNCKLPLTHYYLSKLNGEEDSEIYNDKHFWCFKVVLDHIYRYRYIVAAFIFSLFLISYNWKVVSNYSFELLFKSIDYIFNTVSNLGKIKADTVSTALVVGSLAAIVGVAILPGIKFVKSLFFKIKTGFNKALPYINSEYINLLKRKYNVNKDINELKSSDEKVSELVRLLHLEIEDSAKLNLKKSFAISLKIKQEGYEADNDEIIVFTVRKLFENRRLFNNHKFMRLNYIIISNKFNLFVKLGVREKDVYEVDLFNKSESLEYIAKYISWKNDSVEFKGSVLGMIWNKLTINYNFIINESSNPKFESYKLDVDNGLVDQIRDISSFLCEIRKINENNQKLQTTYNEFEKHINLLIALVENVNDQGSPGFTVQELRDRINLFNDEFCECTVDNLGNEIKKKLDHILKKKCLFDYEKVRKLNDDNLELSSAYIKLWLKYTEARGNRLDSLLSLGKKSNDDTANEQIKNTICLMLSVDKEIIDTLSDKVDNSVLKETYNFIPFNHVDIKKIKQNRLICDKEGDIKPNIRSFITYDRNHYTTAIEGIRVYYEKLIEYVIDNQSEPLKIIEITKLFMRIYIAEEQQMTDGKNGCFNNSWAYGIFSHPSSDKFIEHIYKYFCSNDETFGNSIYAGYQDNEIQPIIEQVLSILTEVIMRACTLKYDSKNSSCKTIHFCNLLRPNILRSEIGEKYIKVAENYIERNISNIHFKESKVRNYFYRVFYLYSFYHPV